MNETEFKSEEERLAAFAMLRQTTHEQMKKELLDRETHNPHPTEVELRLKAFVEELEPQVRGALQVFVEKGYTPNSSGFYGMNGERQVIDGYFDFTKDEQQRIEEAGAIVTEKDSSGDREFSITFVQNTPDLNAMTEQWNKIAAALPDRGRIADPSINGDFRFLNQYAPDRTDIEATILRTRLMNRENIDPSVVPKLEARLKEIESIR